VDQAANTITTIAGTPMTPGFQDGNQTDALPPRFLFPRSVAIHPDGTLIVADPNNQRIRRVNVVTGTVTTLKGDGVPAFSNDPGARFNNPLGVSVDSLGNVIVADEGNHLIRRFSVLGNIVGNVETIAGSSAGFMDGPGAVAQFDSPSGLAVDASTDTIIYVADLANNRIRRIVLGPGPAVVVDTLAGGVEGFADAPVGGAAQFRGPMGVAAGATAVFVADLGNQRIRRIALPLQ
jgi:sugar lactone lactonase YvrE